MPSCTTPAHPLGETCRHPRSLARTRMRRHLLGASHRAATAAGPCTGLHLKERSLSEHASPALRRKQRGAGGNSPGCRSITRRLAAQEPSMGGYSRATSSSTAISPATCGSAACTPSGKQPGRAPKAAVSWPTHIDPVPKGVHMNVDEGPRDQKDDPCRRERVSDALRFASACGCRCLSGFAAGWEAGRAEMPWSCAGLLP